ncbi:MAG: TerB family tellurite resistance protein [Pseudomonadales bacterium]
MLTRLLDRIRIRNAREQDGQPVTVLAAAILLLEVAWADHDISDEEIAILRSALTTQFELDGTTLDALIEESRQAQAQSVGVQPYTQAINESWNEQERFELVVNLWRLAYAGAGVDPLEEHTIRRIADLLYLSHRRFIEAKFLARQSA